MARHAQPHLFQTNRSCRGATCLAEALPDVPHMSQTHPSCKTSPELAVSFLSAPVRSCPDGTHLYGTILVVPFLLLRATPRSAPPIPTAPHHSCHCMTCHATPSLAQPIRSCSCEPRRAPTRQNPPPNAPPFLRCRTMKQEITRPSAAEPLSQLLGAFASRL